MEAAQVAAAQPARPYLFIDEINRLTWPKFWEAIYLLEPQEADRTLQLPMTLASPFIRN